MKKKKRIIIIPTASLPQFICWQKNFDEGFKYSHERFWVTNKKQNYTMWKFQHHWSNKFSCHWFEKWNILCKDKISDVSKI